MPQLLQMSLVRWRLYLYERTYVVTNGKKQGSSRARVPFHLDASSGMTKWAGAAWRGSRHAAAAPRRRRWS